jgi:regulatory protein
MDDIEEIIAKAKKFCAYSERSRMDVVRKLFSLKVPEEWHQSVISNLYNENFLSDERFIRLFIQSKINQKKWGKLKIKAALFNHGFYDQDTEGFFTNEFAEKLSKNLDYLISKKTEEMQEKNNPKFYEQLRSYLYTKGYEPEMIAKHLKF